MLSLPARTNVYLCVRPVDLRKSFDGLSAMVEVVFQHNVLDGHLFLFINKRRDRVKALWWEQDGLVIWYKEFESHYPHFLLFTENGRYRDNLAQRPAAVVGMDSGPPRIGPRRRPMSGGIAVIVPPRAEFAAGP
jgi:transposase